jgi:hypothetical protein
VNNRAVNVVRWNFAGQTQVCIGVAGGPGEDSIVASRRRV